MFLSDNSVDSNNSKYLCITAATLMVPLMVYMNRAAESYITESDKETIPLVEHGLAVLLFFAIYASQWFWSNAEKNSLSHRVDGIIAKITIVSFLLYEFLFERGVGTHTPNLMFLVALLFIFAAMSHRESSLKWCSDRHLFWHGGMHIIGSICSAYAFM